MRPRVALLTNIPAPYRVPFFRALGERVELRVIFDAISEPERRWVVHREGLGFDHGFVRGLSVKYRYRTTEPPVLEVRARHVPLSLLPTLRRFKPDVVVSLEFGARTLQAAAYCSISGTPLIPWWGGTPHTERSIGTARRAVRRMLVRRASRIWSYGEESDRELLSYGAAVERIDSGMTGLDVAGLQRRVTDHVADPGSLRARLGLQGTVILFVATMSDRKGLRELLAALELLAGRHPDGWSALLVGDGPLQGYLDDWKRNHPDVRLATPGFFQPEDLPQYFAAGDILCVPTLEDVWSLVYLEGIAAGLPQIFSPFAGATADLFRHEELGTVADPRDIKGLADALERYVTAPPARVPDDLVEKVTSFYRPEMLAERAEASIRKALAG